MLRAGHRAAASAATLVRGAAAARRAGIGHCTGTDRPGRADSAAATVIAARAATAATVTAAYAGIEVWSHRWTAIPRNVVRPAERCLGEVELPQYAAHNCIWHAIGMFRPGQLKNDLASVSLKSEVNVPSAGSAVPSHQCWHA